MTNPRRGPQVPRPADFEPTNVTSTRRYVYAFDYKLKIVRRTAIMVGDQSPTIYFSLIDTSTAPKKPRRLAVKWMVRPLLATAALAAFMLLIFPYYPAVEYRVNQQFGAKVIQAAATSPSTAQATDVPLTTTNELIIPKIGVDTQIWEGPSLNILLKHEGVWHQTGSFINGSMVVAGHRFRYLPPNTSTLYDLGQMKVGDTEYVDWYGHRYQFVVDTVKTIPSSDTAILKPGTPGTLIVYTCQDWSMSQRIMVQAHLLP